MLISKKLLRSDETVPNSSSAPEEGAEVEEASVNLAKESSKDEMMSGDLDEETADALEQ
jgi:hypothetical protein